MPAKANKMREQHQRLTRGGRLGNRIARSTRTHDDQRIGARQLRLQRRTQGAGGKHKAIAEPTITVDHDQRSILRDRRILETIVHQDHAGALRPCQRHAVDAVARHRNRQVGSKHQGLVANVSGAVARRIDHDRTTKPPAIAAAEHHRRLVQLAQNLGEREHRWRLAGAADVIIANTEHGNAGVKTATPQPLRCDRAIERAERPKQMRFP
jgi:hypothetical protein